MVERFFRRSKKAVTVRRPVSELLVSDTAFWDYCRSMSIPESLSSYMELFGESGLFFRNGTEMFGLTSWV
jgi:hypothetical protein